MKLLERTKKAAKNFENDTEGIMLPILAGMVIVFVLLGTVNFSLLIMYRDRAAVRNALDAAVASSLAAHTRELHVHLNYGERRDVISTNRYIRGVTINCGYTNHDPPRAISGRDCRYRTENKVYLWRNTKTISKNYIHLPVSAANATARSYFNENLEMNIGSNTRVRDWNYRVRYDDARFYNIHKNRTYMNQPRTIRSLSMGTTTCTSTRCGGGDGTSPKVLQSGIYNEVTNAHETYGSWWNGSSRGFVGADTGSWGGAPGFSSNPVETINDVLFPRWVEVTATATVEMPVPFPSVLGRRTYNATFTITAFKELVRAIP